MKDKSAKRCNIVVLFALVCFMPFAMVLIGAWRERIDMKRVADVADRYDRIVNASDKTTKDDDGKNITVEQTKNKCTQTVVQTKNKRTQIDCTVFDVWDEWDEFDEW